MGLDKPCTHGRVLCGLIGGVRGAAIKADEFLQDYGGPIGRTAQALAPVAGVLAGPQTALVAGGVGAAIQSYAQVRNEME